MKSIFFYLYTSRSSSLIYSFLRTLSSGIYFTLAVFVIGALCGIIGPVKKNATAVFFSAICHIEIFLGELEFGLIGAMVSSNRIDLAVISFQEYHIETFVENPFNVSQESENILWAAMQIQFREFLTRLTAYSQIFNMCVVISFAKKTFGASLLVQIWKIHDQFIRRKIRNSQTRKFATCWARK